MNTFPTAHLTEEQFAECLMAGASTPSCRQHLAQCEECREEVSLFLSSIGDFSSASLQWSESRPAVSLRDIGDAQHGHRAAFAPVGWALAAAVLLAIGVPSLHHEQGLASGTVTAISSSVEESEAQIAQDNTLLQSVDMALAQNDPSPFREYDLSIERGKHTGMVVALPRVKGSKQ